MNGYSGTGRVDNETMGIVGLVCAVAGFFALGILLGPAAMVAGWFALGRRWPRTGGARPVTALIAVVLGAIDTLLALLALAGATGYHGVL
jgi:hypothetical protein